jgi:hypothetical protein
MRTRTTLIRMLLVTGTVSIFPAPALSQAPSREATLDLRPFSADLGMAWRTSGPHMLGFTVGASAGDELNRTFRPEIVDTVSAFVTLEQIVRAGAVYRYESGHRMNADVALRFALGGVRGTSGSMDAVAALQTGVYFGTRRVRAGPRLYIARSTEHDVGTIVHVEWFTLRLRVPL